jgi:hypothetical protein
MLKLAGATTAAAATSSLFGATTSPATARSIDRAAAVRRHNPVVRQIDPFSALTVGNGELAFTADVTGLQSFPERYEKEFPLCTTAHWAWHTTPAPPDVDPGRFRYKDFDTYGRPVPYATDKTGQEPLFNWLRENPHRMHLGRIGFRLPSTEIADAEQTLDLWTGLLSSRFTVAGQSVEVQACVEPSRDILAIRVRSPLLREQRLGIGITFPYPSPQRPMADWNLPTGHSTQLQSQTHIDAKISRRADESSYAVGLRWIGQLTRESEHAYLLNSKDGALELIVHFHPSAFCEELPSFDWCRDASAKHWERFWSTGGAIDLSGSTHAKASELERRIVLSQYNTALHCAGSLPSQETGLLFNSWNGKFHLEMHLWHSVHFVAWNRFPLLERSHGYYEKILPRARELAQQQGFRGARWPKMVGPDGRDSPSPVGPLLVWQQPHPIYYAWLCYRHYLDRATLERWWPVVEASAEFMASYAHLVGDRYVLGPPMKTVSENADTRTTINPTFELAYWGFGLSAAQELRYALHGRRDESWDEVLGKRSKLPTQDGVYLMQEGMTDTFTKWNWEHPALLMPGAMLARASYDADTMRRTVRKVMETWQWDRAWGWDFGVAAAAAAIVGEPELAIQALLIDSPKNRYHPNGHNYQRENLTAYLPGNGSLLLAAAAIGSARDFRVPGWAIKSEGVTRVC